VFCRSDLGGAIPPSDNPLSRAKSAAALHVTRRDVVPAVLPSSIETDEQDGKWTDDAPRSDRHELGRTGAWFSARFDRAVCWRKRGLHGPHRSSNGPGLRWIRRRSRACGFRVVGVEFHISRSNEAENKCLKGQRTRFANVLG
jgi:hypothetical protein